MTSPVLKDVAEMMRDIGIIAGERDEARRQRDTVAGFTADEKDELFRLLRRIVQLLEVAAEVRR